jgi:hypothetical protein
VSAGKGITRGGMFIYWFPLPGGDDADGDALINVTTSSSLYGVFPIYNILGLPVRR